MNRKQKIIVSVVGITIVLLALLGLTYAYFLTRIQGNTNEKSISVTTADLKLVYDDGSDGVVGGENLLPSDTVYTKTFTVKNEGNANVEYGVYLIDVINTFERLDDIKYTLNCTTDGTITCNEVTTETTFPSGIKQLITNEIEPKKTHTYTFKFTYKDTNMDQSVDMGKVLQAKLQIFGKNSNGEFMPYEESSLAYNIINNAKLAKNGTTFSAIPLTIPAQETSGYKYFTDKVDEATTETSTSISTTYQGYYWTYGTGYTIDESTGRFTLTGVATCKYNDGTCNTTLVGKYLVSNSMYDNSSSTNTQKTTTNLSSIYKVTTAPASSTSSITLKSKQQISTGYGTEATLSITEDDYGTSYYYRGVVKDDYIEFNNMCWRIVRIEGDGSIKIILAKEGLCSTITSSDTKTALINNGNTVVYGYDSNNKADYENYSGGLYTTLKTWYTSSGLENKKTLLKNEKWCLGGSDNYRYNKDTGALLTDAEVTEIENNNGTYYYTAGKRIYGISTDKSATLKCTSEENSISDYIGTITADEVAYAGSKTYTSGETYKGNYLYDNAQYYYWSLSRSDFDSDYGNGGRTFIVDSVGRLDNGDVNISVGGVRPTVTLATGAQIASGDGTISNPYKILES
mgnify:CR=1 FL=1